MVSGKEQAHAASDSTRSPCASVRPWRRRGLRRICAHGGSVGSGPTWTVAASMATIPRRGRALRRAARSWKSEGRRLGSVVRRWIPSRCTGGRSRARGGRVRAFGAGDEASELAVGAVDPLARCYSGAESTSSVLAGKGSADGSLLPGDQFQFVASGGRPAPIIGRGARA